MQPPPTPCPSWLGKITLVELLPDAAVQGTETSVRTKRWHLHCGSLLAENSQAEANATKKARMLSFHRQHSFTCELLFQLLCKRLIVHTQVALVWKVTSSSLAVNQVTSPMQLLVKYCCPVQNLPKFGKQVRRHL